MKESIKVCDSIDKSYMKSILRDLSDIHVIEESKNIVNIKVYGKSISIVSAPYGNLLIYIYDDDENSQCSSRCEDIQLIDPKSLKNIRRILGDEV